MEAPFINLEALENLIDLRDKLVAEDLYVLVRSFPGPVGSPILSVGGLSTPQLPDHYPYPNPRDNLGVQQAMRVRILKIDVKRTSWPYFRVKLSCVCLMIA